MNRTSMLPFFVLLAASSALAGCSDSEPEAKGPVAEEPNKDIAYLGVDGAFTSDPAAAECPDDPRNPGKVVLSQMEEFSFYKDREGMEPLAEKCLYDYKGYEGDPHHFPEFVTSVWLKFELTSGGAGCEAFTYVVMRPPHGDGTVKHMHLRYGDKASSSDALLEMSVGEYEDQDVCDPWWSVYCTEGFEGCDG